MMMYSVGLEVYILSVRTFCMRATKAYAIVRMLDVALVVLQSDKYRKSHQLGQLSNGIWLNSVSISGPCRFLLYANNKVVDQPAHPRSLISAFVIRSWKVIFKNIKSKNFLLAKLQYPNFYLGAEKAGLNNPEDKFYCD